MTRGARGVSSVRSRAPRAEGHRTVRLTPAACVLGFAVLVGWRLYAWSGSGTAALLITGTCLLLVVDGLWSWFALRRVALDVFTPGDAVVGHPISVRLRIDAPAGGAGIRLAGPFASAYVTTRAPQSGNVELTPNHRGIVEAMTIEVVATEPLGLVLVSRIVTVSLTSPLEVAPSPLPRDPFELTTSPVHPDGHVTRAAHDAEVPRSVRDHRPGDGWRKVHWPATARSGTLMAKEMETPEGPRALVVVDLGPQRGEAAERTAAEAAWVVFDLLARGMAVSLLTRERNGPIRADVATPVETGRRLARAVVGEPLELPVGSALPSLRLCPQPEIGP